MDTPTQIILGAAVGQACCNRTLGRKAVWWGALGGLLPDLDMVVAHALGPWGEYHVHRGPTHSVFFGLLVGPLIGLGVWRWYRRTHERGEGVASGARSIHPGDPILPGVWILLFTAAILTHPLLDIFTSYGTQLFWPLSTRRIALNGIGIIDPLYTLVLLIALVVGWRTRRLGPCTGQRAAALALVLTTAYLFLGFGLNRRAEAVVREQLSSEGVGEADIRCYPTVFQLFLRRVVVMRPGEIRIGKYTFLDAGPVRWRQFEPESSVLAEGVLATPLGRSFQWFSMGCFTSRVVETDQGFVVEIDDLRFGYPTGLPSRGLWGIRRRFDREGRPISEVERFRRKLPVPIGSLIRILWQDILGSRVNS